MDEEIILDSTEETTAIIGIKAPKTPNNSPASTVIVTPTSAQTGICFFSSMIRYNAEGVASTVSIPKVSSDNANRDNKSAIDNLMDDMDLSDLQLDKSSKLMTGFKNQSHNNQDGPIENEVLDWGDSDNMSCVLGRGQSY